MQSESVYAFDRDGTVSTGGGPIPISVLEQLAEQDHYEVYAIGNQRLVDEVDGPITGLADLDLRHGILGAVPFIRRRTKQGALDQIRTRHEQATSFIVVDDVQLAASGWLYATPEAFADVHYTSDMYAGP